jgi:hypothetical protein
MNERRTKIFHVDDGGCAARAAQIILESPALKAQHQLVAGLTHTSVSMPRCGALDPREVEFEWRWAMASPQPSVGSWYRLEGGELFEVVAIDDDDATIEIQYFDGTVEEMDLEEWEAHCDERALRPADPPEDWSGSVDVEPDAESARSDPYSDDRDVRASSLDGLDIFDSQ